MQNLLDEESQLLQAEQAFISDGAILKNAVIEAALNMDPRLLELLMQSDKIKCHFFSEVRGAGQRLSSLGGKSPQPRRNHLNPRQDELVAYYDFSFPKLRLAGTKKMHTAIGFTRNAERGHEPWVGERRHLQVIYAKPRPCRCSDTRSIHNLK